jgi:hypothetical protein
MVESDPWICIPRIADEFQTYPIADDPWDGHPSRVAAIGINQKSIAEMEY